MQEQIRPHRAAEPGNGRGIKGDAMGKGPLQFLRHDRDVLLPPRDITKGQADELHILLLCVFIYVFRRINHRLPLSIKKETSARRQLLAPAPANVLVYGVIILPLLAPVNLFPL